MSCTHPRIMAVCDISKFNDKQFTDNGEVVRSWLQCTQQLKDHGWKINYDTQRAYRLVSKDSREHELESIPSWSLLDDMEISCCNCIQCRLDYSKTWAIRCYYESLQYKCNYFVTLTIEDDHMMTGPTGNPSLDRDVITQFIKSLRQKFKRKYNHVGIRYFGCGEYGDLSFRPHYHLILFNCPIPDLDINFNDDDGQITQRSSRYGPMYYSQTIKDLWPYGFVTIEDANYNTEAYVSRYIMKKQKGEAGKEIYVKNLGIVPPFIMMSLKPAIGSQFFEDNENWLIDDPSLIVPRAGSEPLVTGVPRFYKKKILDRHPDLYDDMLRKAKENTLKARSLLKGKQKINDNRANQEFLMVSKFNAFHRDF